MDKQKVLSRPEEERSQRAGRHGGYGIFALVRATACRIRFRAVDRRSCADQGQASEEAEVRPRGCPTSTQADARKQLPANLGTQSGESGSAATTVAPASAGADTHADHESAASSSHERRQT